MNDVQKIKQRFGIIGNYIDLNRAIDIAMQVASLNGGVANAIEVTD